MSVLSKSQLNAVGQAISAIHASLSQVSVLIQKESALSPLLTWHEAVTKKCGSVQLASEGKEAINFPAWNSGPFAEGVLHEQSLREIDARTMLTLFAPVREALNELVFQLSTQGSDTSSIRILAGKLIGDFVSVESALYGRFPHLEGEDLTG